MIRMSQLFAACFVTSTLLSAAAVAREPNEPPRHEDRREDHREDRREDRHQDRREDRREDRHQDRSGPSGHDDKGRQNPTEHSGHGQRG